MKKLLLAPLVLIMAFGFQGCLKGSTECSDKSAASELAAMQSYASTIGMTATQHSSGMLYQITAQGSGATATASSKIYIRYTGKLITNGNIFDQQTDYTKTGFTLSALIAGWQIGIPLIQKGGSIKLIIPSSLAYGCRGQYTIPANAVLYFEIELVDIQ